MSSLCPKSLPVIIQEEVTVGSEVETGQQISEFSFDTLHVQVSPEIFHLAYSHSFPFIQEVTCHMRPSFYHDLHSSYSAFYHTFLASSSLGLYLYSYIHK